MGKKTNEEKQHFYPTCMLATVTSSVTAFSFSR